MDYTLEEIYQIVGKEDKTAGLTFKYGSESFNNYGQFITVDFIYTQKEREERKLAGCVMKPECECRVCKDEFPAFLEAWN